MEFKLIKKVFEIRFEGLRNTQSDMDKLNRIFNSLRKSYTKSNYEFSNQYFIMEESIGGNKCIYTPNKLGIISDSDSSLENFYKLVDLTLYEFNDQELLDNIKRVSTRTYYGKECYDLEEASKAISKCFKIEGEKTNYFGSEIDNVKVGFAIQENQVKTNINISPAKSRRTQIANGELVLEEENCYILADFDIATVNSCKYSNIYEHIINFRILNDKYRRVCDEIL